jgi:hypothetical protein
LNASLRSQFLVEAGSMSDTDFTKAKEARLDAMKQMMKGGVRRSASCRSTSVGR